MLVGRLTVECHKFLNRLFLQTYYPWAFAYYACTQFSVPCRQNIREFKQITTAGATTAAVTEKVWGEYVSVVCQILSLVSKAKYKDERNIS